MVGVVVLARGSEMAGKVVTLVCVLCCQEKQSYMKCGNRYEKMQRKLSRFTGDTSDPKYCKVRLRRVSYSQLPEHLCSSALNFNSGLPFVYITLRFH